MMRILSLLVLLANLPLLSSCAVAQAQDEQEEEEEESGGLSAGTLAGLKFRSIGPSLASGRITDFAVDPNRPSRYFAATASGGLWRTENAGTTWKPVFDGEGSYSLGCVEMDPNDPFVIWVGTGENNSQRSVSFGDGVYKSVDGGNKWKNVGLKESEHIGMIWIDPRDSDTVFVAAQGPLWREGGDRGLYKTTDGGENWRKVLEIDEHTGVNEVHVDPRNPDVMYASSYQRARRVWTLVNGGPGSAIWKSTDAGETWRKTKSGLPGVDLGRIGMDVSPTNPDVVYAIVEAAQGKGGFFRSTNRGETWEKRSDKMSSSPQYYNEIVCDPHDVDKLYLLETFLWVSEDGAKTWSRVPRQDRHVDDHALWIDPDDTDHLLVGCDGGVYESWEGGENWEYKANMPISQFYRVSVDNSKPFYYVYGGTQDNNSMGGPHQTLSRAGIANEDWFVTVGGDGYETLADPNDPNILYSLWQYGGLVRHDRRSGEVTDIKPRQEPGEEPHRWNWDSPLIISPHAATRLYFACQRLFRSDDRGHSWVAVSDDLSRDLDRNQMEIMGRVWGVDTVSKNRSTSPYGNIVALTESPLVEGLIYVGTDDGLVQVTEDGGGSWRKIESFPDVPELSYVSRLEASRHDADTVYLSFSDHKMGNFTPYLLKSTDRGRSWTSIAGDLPERDVVWCVMEDHEKPDLLFVGTEFGVYTSLVGGNEWIRLKGGVPTIAVRDIDIHRGENDLVLGTFGRSFYVLDDYSPLRLLDEAAIEEPGKLFPVADALLYHENSRLGGRRGRGSQGAAYYTAANPPFGATITYHLAEKIMSRAEARRKAEKELRKDGGDVHYPAWEELRAEDQEIAPSILITIYDDTGAVVRRMSGPRGKGLHRVHWNLRYPTSTPISLSAGQNLAPWESPSRGPLALPGRYTVSLAKVVDGEITELSERQAFDVVPLGVATLPAADRAAVLAFQQKVARLQRAVLGAERVLSDVESRLKHCRKAVFETPGASAALIGEAQRLHADLQGIVTAFRGDRTVSSRQEPTSITFRQRVSNIVSHQWNTSSAPTKTEEDAYRYAGEAFATSLQQLRDFLTSLEALELALEAAGAPYTPGRLPDWTIE